MVGSCFLEVHTEETDIVRESFAGPRPQSACRSVLTTALLPPMVVPDGVHGPNGKLHEAQRSYV